MTGSATKDRKNVRTLHQSCRTTVADRFCPAPIAATKLKNDLNGADVPAEDDLDVDCTDEASTLTLMSVAALAAPPDPEPSPSVSSACRDSAPSL